MFSQSQEEVKLEWMYKGPHSNVEREEYLLGRAVDKTLEQLNTEEKQQQLGVQPPKNHVEHECIPPSIRDYKLQAAEQVDLAAKLQEDPLIAIKKREEENRRQFLNNPIQIKKLQKALKMQKSNKKKNKKKSKVNSECDSDTDLDAKLAKKLKILKQNPSALDCNPKSAKKSKEDSVLDTILMHKYNQLKSKLSDDDIRDILQGKIGDSSAASSDSENEKSNKKSKRKRTKNRQRSSSSSSSSNSSTDSSSSSSSTSSSNEDEDRQKRQKNRKNSEQRARKAHSRSDAKKSSKKNRSPSGERNEYKNRKTARTRSRSNEREKNSKNSRIGRRRSRSRSTSNEGEKYRRTKKYDDKNDSKKRTRNISSEERTYRSEKYSRNNDDALKYKSYKYNKDQGRSNYRDKQKIYPKENIKSKRLTNSSEKEVKNVKQKRNHAAKRKKFSDSSNDSDSDSKTRINNESASSASEDSDGNIKRRHKAWGLVRADGTKLPTMKKHESKNIDSKREELKALESKVTNFRKQTKLTEEEKEKKRREMMENAAWRDLERVKNVKRYRENNLKEDQEQKNYDPEFLQKELLKSANSSSVESRIKANINNIQRSGNDMNRHFSKR